MQVGGLPEPIRQIDSDRVAGVDPQRRADVLALIGVALDHRARHVEGCRLHDKRGSQRSVFRLQLDWRLEGAALFSLERRRYGLIGGAASRVGRGAARAAVGGLRVGPTPMTTAMMMNTTRPTTAEGMTSARVRIRPTRFSDGPRPSVWQ